MTSHITCSHQYSAAVYLKIKVCLKKVSEFEALHFTSLYPHNSTDLQCTAPIAMQPHPTELHFTAPNPPNSTALHTHYYTPLYCIVLTTLHDHYSTARHCTATPLLQWISLLHCTPLLHWTVLTTLHHHHSTAFHYTPSTLLHGAMLYTALSFTALYHHCTSLHGTHCTVFYCTALPYNALYFTTLTSTALCCVTHCTVFHCTVQCFICTVFYNPSSALYSNACYCVVQWSTLHFTSTSLHSTTLLGASSLHNIAPIILFFTAQSALHSLPREGAHIIL